MNSVKPFTVIATNYIDLQGHVKLNPDNSQQKGLFVVVANTPDGCLVCCKITSQITPYLNEYTVPLAKCFNSFLYTDSFVQCDKLHILKKTRDTLELGTINNEDRFRIYNNIQKFYSTVLNEGFKYLIPYKRTERYISPNVYAKSLPSSPFGLSEGKEREDR